MISAVILAKNEENTIIDCLESLVWCDEIIVIDDFSNDRTIELIEHLNNRKIKFFKHKLEDDFSLQRNFGLEKANNEWVLFVDADERISLSLQYEILSHLTNSLQNCTGYIMPRRDMMWGRTLGHGESGSTKLLRLAKKSAGKWQGTVHERWIVRGQIGELRNSLLHLPHQTLYEFLKEINYYTSLRAKELYKKKVKVYFWSIVLYPKAKFFLNYFVKRGFLDGIEGFIVAILMSFHSFLVRTKLWLLWQRNTV